MQRTVSKSGVTSSLTTTLAIAFFALSVLVLLITISLQTFFNVRTQQEAISSKQQIITQDAAKTVSSFVQEKFSVLETTVRLSSPAAAPPASRSLVLQNLLGLQPAFRQLVWLDAQHHEQARASRLSQFAQGQVADLIYGEVPAPIQKQARYISPIYIDAVTNEPMVLLAVPAVSALGDFQGTLVAEVNLKFMWELIDQLQVGSSGLTYVVDRNGSLIAFRDTSRVLRGENVSHLQPVQAFIRNADGDPAARLSLSPGITGDRVVATWVALQTPDWAVVTELHWREAYQDILHALAVSLSILLVVAVLAGVLGVVVARRLTVPLVSLTDTSTRIAGGEIELQALVDGPREVASLATAFNSMTARLRQTLESLEQRVAERTSELRDRNAQLQSAYQTLEDSQTRLLIAEKMASMGRLTAGIAHEMNTPLAAVRLALAELCTRTKEYEDSVDDPEVTAGDHRAIAAEMQMAIRMADSAADSAASFVRAIKTQTRDLAPHERQRFNAVAVVQEALSLFVYLLREAGCTVAFEPPALDLYLYGSPGRLAQIVTNLMTNAIDASTPRGGTITLTLSQEGEEVILKVSDEGCGIPPDVLSKVFDPMFTTKPFGQGTGLGLTLVHDIVTGEFEGAVDVCSQPGQGTTFTLCFPVLRPGERADTPVGAAVAAPGVEERVS